MEFTNHKMKPKSFLKKATEDPIVAWSKKKTKECYLCNRINIMFPRYLSVITQLYKKDEEFREKYKKSKGFCQEHLGTLVEEGQKHLSGPILEDFVNTTLQLYIDNIQRVADDLEWFCNKSDYRFHDAPWKNARDSIERAVIKTNGVMKESK